MFIKIRMDSSVPKSSVEVRKSWQELFQLNPFSKTYLQKGWPSNEVILDLCYSLLNETKRDDNSILGDYPDDFIRKIRLTGLFSLRGGVVL